MTERDDAVSRRYRELPAEEPPRALDEAILAASRRSVSARPAPLVAPAGRQRWYVPLAAAAVIVLAVGLTLRVQLERPGEPERFEMATQPQVLKEEAPQKAQEKPAAEPAPRLMAKQRSRAEESPPAAPAPFPAEPQRGPAVSGEMRAPAAPESRALARSDDSAPRDRAERQLSSVAGATASKRMQEPDETPEKALARISELRQAGKHDEADKALAEFKKRYPDYRIPEATRERVERPPVRAR